MLGLLCWLHYFLIGGKVPQDRTIVRQVLRTVSLPLFICMWTISCIGIMAAIALIVFNLWYRHRRCVFPEYYDFVWNYRIAHKGWKFPVVYCIYEVLVALHCCSIGLSL